MCVFILRFLTAFLITIRASECLLAFLKGQTGDTIYHGPKFCPKVLILYTTLFIIH